MSDDGVTVNHDGEVYYYPADSDCESCGKQAAGVLGSNSDDVPGAYQKGMPLCEECYEGGDHYDDSHYVWVSFGSG